MPRPSFALLDANLSVRRDDGLANTAQNAISRVGRQRSQCRGPESLNDEVDAKRQLPNELRDSRDDLPNRTCLEDPEQNGDPRSTQHRTCNEPQQGQASWNQA